MGSCVEMAVVIVTLSTSHMMSSILRRGLAAVPRLPTLYAGCAVYTRHVAAGAHVSPQPGGQVPCLRSSSQPRARSPPAHVSPRAAPCGPRGQRATGPGSSSTLRPSTILSLGPGGDNVTVKLTLSDSDEH